MEPHEVEPFGYSAVHLAGSGWALRHHCTLSACPSPPPKSQCTAFISCFPPSAFLYYIPRYLPSHAHTFPSFVSTIPCCVSFHTFFHVRYPFTTTITICFQLTRTCSNLTKSTLRFPPPLRYNGRP